MKRKIDEQFFQIAFFKFLLQNISKKYQNSFFFILKNSIFIFYF